MTNPVKRMIPKGLRMRIREMRKRRALQREFVSDGERYVVAAPLAEGASSSLNALQREAQLTRDYHRIEKGLALDAPKRPFGAAVAERLDALLPAAQAESPDAYYVAAATSARAALTAWNDGGAVDEIVAPEAPDGSRGCDDPEVFFTSRHSVRNFQQGSVDPAIVAEAVRLATFSPSVCNRQPWKIRVFEGADVPRILKYQNGNRGFRENVPMLAVVSVELAHFSGPGERNQAWIEGGIFSSSLVWAMHGLGLDSCMLNLSITNSAADALREAAGIPASEVPIMMIAFGRGAEGHRVARSPRRELDAVLALAPQEAPVRV